MIAGLWKGNAGEKLSLSGLFHTLFPKGMLMVLLTDGCPSQHQGSSSGTQTGND